MKEVKRTEIIKTTRVPQQMVYWKIMSYISYCGKSKVGSCWGLQQSACIQRKHKVFGPARFHLATAPNLSQPTDWRFPGVINKSLDLLLLKSVKRFRDFLLILLCSILRLHLKKKIHWSLSQFMLFQCFVVFLLSFWTCWLMVEQCLWKKKIKLDLTPSL